MIEVVSQVIFSDSATVHFELLVGRDAKSIEFFSAGGASSGLGPAGKFHEHWSPETKCRQVIVTNGIFSKSVTLRVDDTSSLWNTPPLPPMAQDETKCTDTGNRASDEFENQPLTAMEETPQPSKHPKRRIHLVVITHGLHSNLGADMLYLKESIDAAAKKSRERENGKQKVRENADEIDEDVIVRGFAGNAVRTERGIQYLGKRLAKYVLLMTYPDQPYFPLKGSKSSKPFSRPFSSRREQTEPAIDLHPPSLIRDDSEDGGGHAYQISSISFIGHSLGGLIQTYAIAYIQKHSPEFFDRIKPINFIALATPFLGLSNENPMYVRFALDLGLVGRTGQDLGLSWTAPRVRSGWGAIIGGRGDSAKDQGQSDPGAKPLLRILPCGPAHEVLHRFRHRTLYSNVVNDGIVPLRTSCLLFLDWRGLDRVEKARRDNGLVGTMAEWGWAELTGANSKSPAQLARTEGISVLGDATDEGSSDGTRDRDVAIAEGPSSPSHEQFPSHRRISSHGSSAVEGTRKENSTVNNESGPFSSFLALFRPKETKPPGKHSKIYKRSQTLDTFDANPAPLVRGSSLYYEEEGVYTPPRTTFFESAGDLLMPPLPSTSFILDPEARPRTIFHDRIYHPDDIPHPLPVKRRTLTLGSSQQKHTESTPGSKTPAPSGSGTSGKPSESGLRVEEKIARAYHRDLSWRKVLVRLEPDAHNNIIVRRMFTNAYGWPVVKHLVDTHFGHFDPEVDDTQKRNVERAKPTNIGPTSSGNEVEEQTGSPEREPALDHASSAPYGDAEVVGHPQMLDQSDTFPAEDKSHETTSTPGQSQYTGVSRQDSARWTDRQVDEDDDCESGFEEEESVGFRWSPSPRQAQ